MTQAIINTTTSTAALPGRYLCALTKKLMKEPVRSNIHHGHHFERSAILQYLETHDYCPITGNPLQACDLVLNQTLQHMIRSWAKANGVDLSLEDGEETQHKCNSNGSNPSSDIPSSPPQRFLCPLSRKVMKDPVMTKRGVSYERKQILQWLNFDDLCPVTSTPLTRSSLTANRELAGEISEWKQQQKQQQQRADRLPSGVPSKIYVDVDKHNALIRSSLIRSIPTSFTDYSTASTSRSDPQNLLLDALDTALSCSIGVQ
jgi:hypothetical protein